MSGELYFRYPILDLTYGQRFIRRTGYTTLHIILAVAAVVMLFSDVSNLFLLGVLASAYLLFRFGIKLIRSKPRIRFRGGNLLEFTAPRTKKIILAAYDRSVFLGGSFLLYLARELIEEPMIIRVLKGLDVGRDEFISKLEAYLADERGIKETNIWRQAKLEEAMIQAFILQESEKSPISPFHLFVALPHTDNEKVRRLFVLFGLGTDNLTRAARYHSLISV
ncbi:MAG: hypothetical protein PHV43_00630 [Candidatus Colwellbacteria bacterium]|nr:hypothetical protein [Candidatus Colwellbacteria bacterium]